MKKFLFKLFLILSIIVAINNVIFFTFNLPFCWGNDIAFSKEDFLIKHSKDYNTVFIGTSKTYWQADVSAFDSLTLHKTKSFNFGIDAIAEAEILDYTNHLVTIDKNIKYVFIETFDIDLIVDHNLHTCRQKYWFNFNAWWFTIKSIWGSDYGFGDKCRGYAYNTITFVEWLLKWDLLKDVNRFKHTPSNADYLGNNQTGFVALGDEKIDFDYHLSYRNRLLKDTSINKEITDASVWVFTHYKDSVKFNTAFYNGLESEIKNLQSKNIRVFLVMSPRTHEIQLKNFAPPFMEVVDCEKINLADARYNPEFYDIKNAYDPTHLNKAGDKIYTEKIAKAFNEDIAKAK